MWDLSIATRRVHVVKLSTPTCHACHLAGFKNVRVVLDLTLQAAGVQLPCDQEVQMKARYVLILLVAQVGSTGSTHTGSTHCTAGR